MKKYFFPVAMATTLLASVSCSSDVMEELIPTNQKSLIEFSMSEGIQSGPAQRTVTAGAFPEGSNIIMHIRSNQGGGTTNVRRNKALAVANVHNDHSDLTFELGQQRYWDDAFGRSAHLSVYAVAVPGTGNTHNTKLQDALSGGVVENVWTSCNDADEITTTWTVTTDKQTEDILKNEDLVYSNNIKAGGMDGRTWYDWEHATWKPADHTGVEGQHGNGCLQFLNETADPSSRGYFDKGHLKFTHALSRMTITLVEGAGFNNSSDADFQFTHTKVAAGSNIKLQGMNTSGKLNMKTGEWDIQPDQDIQDIMVMSGSTTAAAGDYKAQMLPDYVIEKDGTQNVMSFEIDDNIYYVTQGDLFKALASVESNKNPEFGYAETGYTMKQGINYHFTITVNKKQIDNITATVLDWNTVTAGNFPLDNSHVEFSLKDVTGTACNDIKFFRKGEILSSEDGPIFTDNNYTANDFSGQYEGPAALTETDAVTHTYKTNEWFYENNKTAYHFRTLNTKANAALAGDKDTFSMTHGEKTDANDYHWGAPMKHDATLSYNPTANEGFKANIHKGITSTTSPLKITEFHMLSWVDVKLKTSSDKSKVNLKDATVTVNRIRPKATVDMGTGYIAPKDGLISQLMTAPSFTGWTGTETETGSYSWQFIPQTLVRNAGADVNPSYTSANDDDYVGITIRTKDNDEYTNEYYIVKKLSEIKVTSVDHDRDHTDGSYIKRWYPGHHYKYTITITKKGITDITATLLDWNTVNAGDIGIDLED